MGFFSRCIRCCLKGLVLMGLLAAYASVRPILREFVPLIKVEFGDDSLTLRLMDGNNNSAITTSGSSSSRALDEIDNGGRQIDSGIGIAITSDANAEAEANADAQDISASTATTTIPSSTTTTPSTTTTTQPTKKNKKGKKKGKKTAPPAATAATATPTAATVAGATSGAMPKVAIYMTTHISNTHVKFLEKCWPAAIEKLPLVKRAHLIVYTSIAKKSNKNKFHYFTDLKFPNVRITTYRESRFLPSFKQKQEGAIKAMVDPFLPDNQWFLNYDWIIRVNPDVLIRRDDWLLEQMRDPNVDAILAGMTRKSGAEWIHTDFFAFRPRAVNHTAWADLYRQSIAAQKFHAETHIQAGFQPILDTGRVAWLPNVQHNGKIARLEGRQVDVLHVHSLVDRCPNYFNATDKWHF